MNKLCQLLVLCACSGPIEAALLDEQFDSGFPGGFVVTSGSASVSGGLLHMNSACIQLPGTYSRGQNLAIEARVRIGNASYGDFNVHGLYDTNPVCVTIPTNGYFTGWYPSGSDNPQDLIDVGVGGVGSRIADTPSSVVAGQWYILREEFLADGKIKTYINGINTMTVVNSTHVSGRLGLRSWFDVDVDWVAVSTEIPEPSSFAMIVLGGCLFRALRQSRQAQ